MAKKSRFRQLAGAAKDLESRTKESYKTRDSSGKFENYISKDVPLAEWKCKEGDHIIDIIPWIAGPGHPTVGEGEGTYLLDLWAHQKIGVNENSYLCPSRNYGKACPICEDIAAIKKQKGYDEEYVKQMEPKRRILYAIVVYDTPQEEEASPWIWEASHFLTEKNISAIARNKRTGGFTAFANPDEGKSIEFTREGTGIGTKYTGYQLTDRDYIISDEMLEAVPELDQYVTCLSYAELEAVYYGGAPAEPEQEPEYEPEPEPDPEPVYEDDAGYDEVGDGQEEFPPEEEPPADEVQQEEEQVEETPPPKPTRPRPALRGRVGKTAPKETPKPAPKTRPKPAPRGRGRIARPTAGKPAPKTRPKPSPRTGTRLTRRAPAKEPE